MSNYNHQIYTSRAELLANTEWLKDNTPPEPNKFTKEERREMRKKRKRKNG